jgi:ubiquinone/menaquinone biosynthesis C-methylase UbiE
MSDPEGFVRFCESDFGSTVMDREADYVRNVLTTSGRILNVGSGISALEKRLVYFDVIGIDLSFEMLSEANRRARAPLVNGDARNLPFRECSLQAVVTIATLEFITEVDEVLDEIQRVLAPEAQLIALILNSRSQYVRRNLKREGSYFQNMVHRDTEALAERIGQQFEIETEYFLGIEEETVFETEAPERAAILAVRGST